MNKWFRKGNARRFHRIDMPIRYFIVPRSPIKDREIYATGADYFPASLLSKIEANKDFTIQCVSRIQEQNALLTEIFEEIIQFIEFFGECARSISQGQNPRQDPSYWMRVKEHQQGFKKAIRIQASSPKTFQYLQMIEDKYLTFLNRIVESIDKSTPVHFYVSGHLPVGFKVEEMISTFQSPKFEKIPLIQAILNLSKFMDAYLEIYRQINDDNYLKQFPQEWVLKKANTSASGLAVLMDKRYDLYSRVDVFLYFEEQDRILPFEGTVVDIRTDERKQMERIAINFEFPDGKDQDFLQLEIQKQEIKECMKIIL